MTLGYDLHDPWWGGTSHWARPVLAVVNLDTISRAYSSVCNNRMVRFRDGGPCPEYVWYQHRYVERQTASGPKFGKAPLAFGALQ